MENFSALAVGQMAPQKKRPWLKPVIIMGVFGAIVLLGIFAENPLTASRTEVGACLKGNVDNADSIRNVECGTPEANFKVVGKQGGKSEGGILLSGGSECDGYLNADLYYFQGRQSADDGVLLCLENLKNPGPRLPAVGDCFAGDLFAAKKLEKVDCAGAHFKVLAIEREPEVSIGTTTCSSVPGTDMKLTWASGAGGLIPRERVVCLDELK
ncbi:LppU/SCO3897 family protein [Amycolatopsis sp. w19]|uniref:LppU/SCO3897 family protein n=1 Tax=Amycolatopsis sp. w19 TaxID=3448134 RepID=UPI003F1E0CCB